MYYKYLTFAFSLLLTSIIPLQAQSLEDLLENQDIEDIELGNEEDSINIDKSKIYTWKDAIVNPSQVYILEITQKIDLAQFQQKIVEFENIEELTLSFAQIKAIPVGIFQLHSLRILRLNNNEIREIPDDIQRLNDLEVLDLSHNQIKEIPQSMFKLTNLLELDLSNNQLISLPKEIGNLDKLIDLELSKNKIKNIPNNIVSLSSLQQLNLRTNYIKNIPNNIGKLFNLQKLGLASNKISEIPNTIGKLISLTELDLGKNNLIKVPNNIGNLKSLSSLNLSYNQIAKIPQEIGQLTNLLRLFISNNQLTKINEGILNLEDLVKLELSNNKIKEIPHDIQNLTKLAELNISSNKLKSLPTSVYKIGLLMIKNNPMTEQRSMSAFFERESVSLDDDLVAQVISSLSKNSKSHKLAQKLYNEKLEYLQKKHPQSLKLGHWLNYGGKIFREMNEMDEALEHTKLAQKLIDNLEVAFDNLAEKESLLNEVKNNQNVIELARNQKILQQSITYVSVGVLILVLIFAIFIYRSRQQQRKANIALEKSAKIIEEEKQKSEDLLLNILPKAVAEELKLNGSAKMRSYERVSILFTDFKGFTEIASKMSPDKLMEELNDCFTAFDKIITKHKMEKIKTIGDAYMCAGGIPKTNDSNPFDSVLAALEMQDFMRRRRDEKLATGDDYWRCRLGINTGEIRAGVIGTSKFAYDIWGNPVNIASRMESGGVIDKVNISENTYDFVKDFFECEYRGEVEVKNGLTLKMYFVHRIKLGFAEDKEGLVPNNLFWEKAKETY